MARQEPSTLDALKDCIDDITAAIDSDIIARSCKNVCQRICFIEEGGVFEQCMDVSWFLLA